MTTETPQLTPVQGGEGKKTPPGAVWSLVLGILSLFCLWILGSIPAIILGALSIKKAKANPETVGGEGIALAGIITGAIGVFTGFVMIGSVAAVAIPTLNSTQNRAFEARAMSNVRQVAMAVVVFSTDHPEGEFPKTLEELIPKYLPDSDLFSVDLGSVENVKIQYRKIPADSLIVEPILYLPLPGGSNHILGYEDGSVDSDTEAIDPALLAGFK